MTLISINFFLAVQEERGPRKTTRLRKLISSYSEIGNQKMNKKNETDDKEVDLTNGDKANFYMWGKYGTQSCIKDLCKDLNSKSFQMNVTKI